MSGRVFLGNAFSLGMLELPRGVGVSLCVEELDLERWVERVRFHRLVSGELVRLLREDRIGFYAVYYGPC